MSVNWLQRLGKWRMVFASWQLGTRTTEDPECQAVRDAAERSLVLRAEMNALTALLVKKKVFTETDFLMQVQEEAQVLCAQLERRFPGFSATDDGMRLEPHRAADTTKGWRP